jgi:hypothetical protein
MRQLSACGSPAPPLLPSTYMVAATVTCTGQPASSNTEPQQWPVSPLWANDGSAALAAGLLDDEMLQLLDWNSSL